MTPLLTFCLEKHSSKEKSKTRHSLKEKGKRLGHVALYANFFCLQSGTCFMLKMKEFDLKKG
jgi:hypothetical protein